jgi:hypothetical protein
LERPLIEGRSLLWSFVRALFAGLPWTLIWAQKPHVYKVFLTPNTGGPFEGNDFS